MYFRQQFEIQQLRLDQREQFAPMFTYAAPQAITIRLRIPTDNERRSNQVRRKNVDIICTADLEEEPSPHLRAMFEMLAQRRLPSGSRPPVPEEPEELDDGSMYYPINYFFDDEGRVDESIVIEIEWLPLPLQKYIQEMDQLLSGYARRTVTVLRWRLGLEGGHDPLRATGSFHWSFDGEVWGELDREWQVMVGGLKWSKLTKDLQTEVEQLVLEGGREPIGHELYREAVGQVNERPRSALVLAIAALEAGFKQCVSELIPDARWLVDEAPTPPLEKMLLSYLPLLPARNNFHGRVLPINRKMRAEVGHWVAQRNKIAHTGRGVVDRTKLAEFMPIVQDILWLLDYYTGAVWALEHIRPETRAALEAESQKAAAAMS